MDELEHVHRCLIEIRKANKEVLTRFGFKTWSSFREAQERVMGAVDKPIELDGYTLYREDTPIRMVAGGKQVGTKSKLKITEK